MEVWQRAVDLVIEVYRLSESFPAKEKYGITSQIQRAAVSIPANIAEGYGRRRRGEYVQFLSIAQGSLAELETHLTIVVRLGFVDRAAAVPVWELAQSVGQMLNKLVASLERPTKPETRNPEPETRNPKP